MFIVMLDMLGMKQASFTLLSQGPSAAPHSIAGRTLLHTSVVGLLRKGELIGPVRSGTGSMHYCKERPVW